MAGKDQSLRSSTPESDEAAAGEGEESRLPPEDSEDDEPLRFDFRFLLDDCLADFLLDDLSFFFLVAFRADFPNDTYPQIFESTGEYSYDPNPNRGLGSSFRNVND